MNPAEVARTLIREYIEKQIKDPDSEFWLEVENDPDAIRMSDEQYDLLLRNIRDAKIRVH